MPEKRLTYFQSLAGTAVDPVAGVIRGASMLTRGEALGHAIDIDDEGLKQALAALNARGTVRLLDRHDGEFSDIHGHAENFRIEGDQIKGDIHLLEHSPKRAAILEIAQKMPSEFGLSIECDNGHIPNPDAPKRKLFRTGSVDAVALVPRPAANPRGLFSAVDTSANANPEDMDKTKLSKALKAAFTKFAEGKPEEQTPEALADAIAGTVTDAVKEDEQANAEKLQKLEEAMPKEPSAEEKEKADKEAEIKLSEKIASAVKTQLESGDTTQLITKLSKEIGLVRAPGAGAGFQLSEKEDEFEKAVKTQLSAGAKNRGIAIQRVAKDNPAIYNAHLASLNK